MFPLQSLLSCEFLSLVKESNSLVHLDYYQDVEKLRKEVERGKYRGYFLIQKNYTPSHMRKFNARGLNALQTPISPVYVALDMTDAETGLNLNFKFN